MSVFERRKRYVTYHDKDCKDYLRKDFNRRCAYCGLREGDIGSPDDFQIDHFFPQNRTDKGKVHSKYQGEEFNVDSYYNLYYSCKRCNGTGGKSGQWSPTLLDPCEDKIFEEHVKLNNSLIFEPMTELGEEFIRTIKLNSKNAKIIRESAFSATSECKKRLFELERFIDMVTDVNAKKFLEEDRRDLLDKIEYGVKYNKNYFYSNDKSFNNIEKILSNYHSKILDGDYGLDYQITLNGVEYDVYICIEENILFTNHKKMYYLRDVQVKDWEKRHVLICHYNKSDNKIYYFINTIRQCKTSKMLSYYIEDNIYLL